MAKVLLLHQGYLAAAAGKTYYVTPAAQICSTPLTHTAFPLFTPQKGKVTSAQIHEYLDDNRDFINTFDYALVTDANYFKVITKQKQAKRVLGQIFTVEGFTCKFLYAPHHFQATLNHAEYAENIKLVYKAIEAQEQGEYVDPGVGIIHSQKYAVTLSEAEELYKHLLEYPELTLDIEAYSLEVTKAGIYTIGFAWDKHNGCCIAIDGSDNPKEMRELLRKFFDEYTGKFIVHKANYDLPVLIYNLYMNEDLTNTQGQLQGWDYFRTKTEDSLIVSYLALNTCGGVALTLKDLGAEYAGNWAIDIKDVTKHPLDVVMKYNLEDCLTTWYVYKKYHAQMVADNQLDIYENHMKPYMFDCIRMQLTGFYVDPVQVEKFGSEVIEEKNKLEQAILTNPLVKAAEYIIAETEMYARNAKLKTKQLTVADVIQPFNCNSNNQLRILLYEVMALPVIDQTDSGAAATSEKVVSTLISHTDNQAYKDLLETISDYMKVIKIATAFVPMLQNPQEDKFGNKRILGYFNVGGTKSGRLSSNNPNMQNWPSTGTKYAKGFKKCITAPDGWIFVGIDFLSLEDRISALTTKDPEKLKIYTDGFDGHSLRAYAYFKELMPDIELAKESERCFTAKVGQSSIFWKSSDTINYQGQSYTGDAFYEMVTSKKL